MPALVHVDAVKGEFGRPSERPEVEVLDAALFAFAHKGIGKVAAGMAKRVAKGKMAQEEMDAILGRIKTRFGIDRKEEWRKVYSY